MSPIPKYGVIYKAYGWDAFIERQARRCSEQTGQGDFLISLDETRGNLGELPFERVIRTSSQALVDMGLADRSERGPLLWWNADYAHYEVLEQYPNYDYYVFLEYDVSYRGSFDRLVTEFDAAGGDFAALPLREDKHHWHWTEPHLGTYTLDQIEGCLMCFSVFSKRALTMLARRRLEMSRREDVPYWPSAEVFLATEVKAAGYRFVSLADFADMSACGYRPPYLEANVLRAAAPAAFHPVYDRKRYVRWCTDQAESVLDYFRPQSAVMRSLRPVPFPGWLLAYAGGVLRSVVAASRYRVGLKAQSPS